MSASDRDPLSPEERELAARLQRLGGPDAPPAALDARILAAARTAAGAPGPARAKRRPRIAAWLPGGAITAIGTAAALAIVIGTTWQLRPADRPAAKAPTTGDDDAVVVELLAPRRTPAVPDAATDAPAAAALQRTRASAAASRASTADSIAERPAVAPGAAAPAAETGPGSTGAVPPEATEPAPTIAPAATATAMDTVEPAADAPPPAAQADATANPRRATYTTAARARAEPRDTPREASARARPDDHDAVDLASIPLHEDANLPPGEWLERIRARRDAGDIEAARASLRRFIRAHPRLRPPRDLRELAR